MFFCVDQMVIVNVKIVHGTMIDDDVLRGAHFRVYALQVIILTLPFSLLYFIILQYPPFMSMIKDPNSRNRTLYQGLSVSFVNYIVQDYNLR